MAAALLLFVIVSARAALPLHVNYSGYLTNAQGAPVNQTVQMTFRIWDALASGNMVWSEVQTVTVNNGVFNALLGSVTAFTFTFNKPYFLEVQVGAETLSPRQSIAGSPFSGFVISASCNGGDFIGCYTGPPGTQGVGACKAGTRTCDPVTNLYGACLGEVTPVAETYDGVDNDCNGIIDNGVIPNGNACTSPAQCISGNCAGGVCGPPPLPNGSACSASSQCQSEYCNPMGFCALRPLGSACNAGAQCASGLCLSNVCSNAMPNGSACSGPTQCQSGFCNMMNLCAGLLQSGAACTADTQCVSGMCIGNVCQ